MNGSTADWPVTLKWSQVSIGKACNPTGSPHISVLIDYDSKRASDPSTVVATLDSDMTSLSVNLTDQSKFF